MRLPRSNASKNSTKRRALSLATAEAGGRVSLSLQAIAELRRTVELLARLPGELDERPAEREARIAEQQGAVIAQVFIAVFADEQLGLDYQTQHRGREVAARHLRAIDAAER